MSKNSELSDLFARFASLMDLKGESAFKSIAFSKVSRVLKDATFDIAEVVREGTLKSVEGIGSSSQKIIEEYLATGKSTDLEQVAADIPPGLIRMLDIPGLGPKTVRLFWQERQITSIEALEKAIAEGTLEGLKGVGAKKIEAISQGIALLKSSAGRIGIGEAVSIAAPLLEQLRALPQVLRAEVAGSLRRRKETIGDIDLVCCLKPEFASAGEAVTAAFAAFPGVQRVLGQGNTKASVLTDNGVQVDCRVVPEASFGAALMYFTGSKEHNVRVRGLALTKGLTLNEWGLYPTAAHDAAEKQTGQPPKLKPVAGTTEKEIYAALDLPYIPPELREDRGETTSALPQLITEADLRGDLHTHTTASDGQNTIEQMAEAARALGYEYLAITDHSKSQVIANGLDAKRLLAHVKAIHAAGKKISGITLLAGCEVDILADGSLDFPDDILAELDWVVASPHVSLRQDEEKATARILRAIDNKYVNVIGHPTGRLLNQREGLPLNFAKVIAAAKDSGTALEINSGYPRLDLSETPARQAIQAGALLSINTDAHYTKGLSERHWGIGVARRAWVTPESVINTWPLKKLLAWANAKRK
jgi:DNA polymerase (family 10)